MASADFLSPPSPLHASVYRGKVRSLSSLEAKACGPHIRTAALASSRSTNIRPSRRSLWYFMQLKHFSANRTSLRSCGVSLGNHIAMFVLPMRSPSLPPPAFSRTLPSRPRASVRSRAPRGGCRRCGLSIILKRHSVGSHSQRIEGDGSHQPTSPNRPAPMQIAKATPKRAITHSN
jgi:hypothetical protein